MNRYEQIVDGIERAGNLRSLPGDAPAALIDLSSNDYLGIGSDAGLRREFLAGAGGLGLTSSASRLLGAVQSPYHRLESLISSLYQRSATLLFNSGYHANVGLMQALAIKGTHIVADRLVHASIIDGMRLSGVPFTRAPHLDMERTARLVRSAFDKGAERVLLVTESVFSMDGDMADIEALIDIKKSHPRGSVILYVDEAHSVGVCGPRGLGLVADSPLGPDVDIVVGTFGKALASVGAFATFSSPAMAQFVINTARSLIFSTALPPLNVAWTEFVVRHSLTLDDRRRHLASISAKLTEAVNQLTGSRLTPSHIIPILVGDARRAVALSQKIAREGFKVLPIRTPTVPAGTERLRVSLSAALSDREIDRFICVLKACLNENKATD